MKDSVDKGKLTRITEEMEDNICVKHEHSIHVIPHARQFCLTKSMISTIPIQKKKSTISTYECLFTLYLFSDMFITLCICSPQVTNTFRSYAGDVTRISA